MKYRIMENGCIAVSKEVRPAPAEDRFGENYEQDIANLYLFHPVYEPCKHRDTRKVKCPRSQRLKDQIYCKLKGIELNANICGSCQEIEE